jgi:hypothetical protein
MDEKNEKQKQVPFDYAQGRLSAPLKYASLRMTRHFVIRELQVWAISALPGPPHQRLPSSRRSSI